MKLQPFVYLSESLIAQRDIIGLISQCAGDAGYHYDRELMEKLWHEITGTTRAQHRKYQLLAQQYKQRALRSWYIDLLDQLHPAAADPSLASRAASHIAESLMKRLSNPLTYSTRPETMAFIQKLQYHGIRWGIIANEDHMYPLALKALDLHPHHLINAHGHTFKPLPKIFQQAWSKVPVENQHDVWFIGDVNNGYDNVSSPLLRSILHTHGRIRDMSDPSHMRIKRLSDLDEILQEEDAHFGELDVSLETHSPKKLDPAVLLARGQRERGVVDLETK